MHDIKLYLALLREEASLMSLYLTGVRSISETDMEILSSSNLNRYMGVWSRCEWCERIMLYYINNAPE